MRRSVMLAIPLLFALGFALGMMSYTGNPRWVKWYSGYHLLKWKSVLVGGGQDVPEWLNSEIFIRGLENKVLRFHTHRPYTIEDVNTPICNDCKVGKRSNNWWYWFND